MGVGFWAGDQTSRWLRLTGRGRFGYAYAIKFGRREGVRMSLGGCLKTMIYRKIVIPDPDPGSTKTMR